jgi:hypothetical protein
MHCSKVRVQKLDLLDHLVDDEDTKEAVGMKPQDCLH